MLSAKSAWITPTQKSLQSINLKLDYEDHTSILPSEIIFCFGLSRLKFQVIEVSYHSTQIKKKKKKDAPIYQLIKHFEEIILAIFKTNILKDFQKIFHSKPIPGLYLQRFRSQSSAKRSTILLKCNFFIGIAKLKKATFLLKLMPFLDILQVQHRHVVQDFQSIGPLICVILHSLLAQDCLLYCYSDSFSDLLTVTCQESAAIRTVLVETRDAKVEMLQSNAHKVI